MDITTLASELSSEDPTLPPAEARFVEAVEDARAALEDGEIDREEYHARVAAASERYRRGPDPDP
ncbi:hypothetical protein C497_15977 [Halalkalicoccus jeotgali B3]|uniref:Uncharacterized protein n=2 Tax=Halalkalicoccus jeotgali TaxID=413810 RepID=D8J7G4_HALJB|nr:hypothetical protein HacjB3_03330 [Halalkalicoccus jeotgali B3]ELY33897.1 hypothetical protein C497_15977 [Halalkalicoccus jeotgali B3]